MASGRISLSGTNVALDSSFNQHWGALAQANLSWDAIRQRTYPVQAQANSSFGSPDYILWVHLYNGYASKGRIYITSPWSEGGSDQTYGNAKQRTVTGVQSISLRVETNDYATDEFTGWWTADTGGTRRYNPTKQLDGDQEFWLTEVYATDTAIINGEILYAQFT